MTHPVPAVIVTIPATTVDGAREEIEIAARGGADLVEIRLDRWPSELRGAVGRLFPSPVPLVATLRSRAEGGEGPDDRSARAAQLLAVAELPFRWIDLEKARDLEIVPELPPPSRIGRIVSTHYPAGVDPETWGQEMRESVAPGSIRKIVAWAPVGVLLSELLPRLPPPGVDAAVAMTTGPSGPLLRAWSRRLGVPMVFAAPPVELPGVDPGDSVEPTQVPVDLLKPFLAAPNDAPLFGVVGHPVAHSRSPLIHGRWMARSGRTGLYVPLDIERESEFLDSIPALADGGFRGLNVTHPWKRAALEVATEVGGGAAACGVANTLTLRGDEIDADNTDLAAAVRRFEELREVGRWDGDSLAVVGAGGAARATLAAARALGVRAAVYARRSEAARELATEFDATLPASGDGRRYSLVVHATTAGRSSSETLGVPIEPLLEPGSHVLDWVYAPEIPEVRTAAVHAGATYEDGRRMLVYQAAASFGLWWGAEPSPELIDATLEEVGCGE
jgi:shikimate dehydrogenase